MATETPADARQITLTMPRPVTLAAIATATVPFLTHAWMALTGYFAPGNPPRAPTVRYERRFAWESPEMYIEERSSEAA